MVDISISNIAWQIHEEEKIRELLLDSGIHHVEIAPGKYFPGIFPYDNNDLQNCKMFWANKGIHIVALQSLLFDHPEMKIFEDTLSRINMLNHLEGCISLGSELGAHAVIFGSPGNRRIPKNKLSGYSGIAQDFFKALGDFAAIHGIYFCIEPNPKDYGTNFLCKTQEALDFIKKIDSNGLKLNFDTGTCIFNRENYKKILPEAIPYLGHFHISEPFLAPINQNTPIHQNLAEILLNENYRGTVSIEMKSVSPVDNFTNIKTAVRYISDLYR
jgi:sugar phosphate isomerase/epimerase